jgi:hypothetical protein
MPPIALARTLTMKTGVRHRKTGGIQTSSSLNCMAALATRIEETENADDAKPTGHRKTGSVSHIVLLRKSKGHKIGHSGPLT